MYFVESEAKRKSEEPLVKLFIVDETKRDELAVGESESRKDVVEKNKGDRKEDKEEEGDDDDEDDKEEVYEVESVIDYDYCKATVSFSRILGGTVYVILN